MSQDSERSKSAAIREAYSARRERRDPPDVVEFVLAERRRLLQRAVNRLVHTPREHLRICDVGCGSGGDLAYWAGEGIPPNRLAGSELLAAPLKEARRRVPEADLKLVDDFIVPWPDATFDVTYSSMAMSSIRSDAARQALFAEMMRVTRPGGVVAIYDFRIRKPTNRRVVAMNASRIGALGMKPQESWRATPFLPLLKYAMRLPSALRRLAIHALPRTHSVWIWQSPSDDAA